MTTEKTIEKAKVTAADVKAEALRAAKFCLEKVQEASGPQANDYANAFKSIMEVFNITAGAAHTEAAAKK